MDRSTLCRGSGMIKEFCMACRGTGISGYYNSATSHKVIDCDYCQGKGWVGLEPSFKGEAVQIGVTQVYRTTVTQSALWGSTELTNIAVYIKEIKEEKE